MRRSVFALLPLLLLSALASGCGGGGAGAASAAGNAGVGGTDVLIVTTAVDPTKCKAAPADLVAAIQKKMGSYSLSHVFVTDDGDLHIVAGRLAGPGRSGTDIATFVATDTTSAATIYALGPNAAQSSKWPDASTVTDVKASLGDDASVVANACAKSQ
jgi:hypothetical protein